MFGDAQLTSQTLSFSDDVTPSMDTRGVPMDHTRDAGFLQDATLSNFFERPIKIGEFVWNTNSGLDELFDPWNLYWSNSAVREKIRNYHLLKCNLHVKFIINGNAFYYGRAIASYIPFQSQDTTSIIRSPVLADIVELSQKMHVYLNPTMCQGGDLQLPFFWNKNALSISENEWTQMGRIQLASLNILQHANGGTAPVTISVFAWSTNVSYSIPTRNVPQAGDEYTKELVSKPATTIARFAGSLATLPWIGPFARATEIGATAVASISKIFGYASPLNLESHLYVPRARNSLATTDDQYMGLKLTVDSKQELTIDPITTGIDSNDELTICGIAQRESFLTTFNWDVNTSAETLLFNTYVDPGIHQVHGPSLEHHLTAAAFASLPFKYWRGTMRFRFQIVASEYHKGRLRVVYDPRTGGSSASYNTHYSKVHDISLAKDFTFDVGWSQTSPYRESFGIDVVGNALMFASGALVAPQATRSNGVLAVYVLNPLTTASTVVSNIQINVFVSMLDDFEVAEPSERLSTVRFTPQPIGGLSITEPESMDYAQGYRGHIYDAQSDDQEFDERFDEIQCNTPESGEMDYYASLPGEGMMQVTTPVEDPVTIGKVADVSIVDKDITKVFFGEVIGSFRQLLKRNYFHERILLPVTPDLSLVSVSRAAFPSFGGYTPTPPPAGSPIIDLNDGNYYYYAETTLMNYLSRAFIGRRGSVRWLLDFSRCHASTVGSGYLGGSTSVVFGRDDDYDITTITFPYSAGSLPGDFLSATANINRGSTSRGASLTNNAVNPLSAVEVPYYLPKRFSLTRALESFTQSNSEPGWLFTFTTFPVARAVDSYVDTYVSAGEDFNFFYYSGLPPIYFEAAAPDPSPV